MRVKASGIGISPQSLNLISPEFEVYTLKYTKEVEQ